MISLKGNPRLSSAASDIVHRHVTVQIQHVDGTGSTFSLDMIDPTLTFPTTQGELYQISCIDVNSAGFSSAASATLSGTVSAPTDSVPVTPVVLGCVFSLA
jgi:hypothetical protein